ISAVQTEVAAARQAANNAPVMRDLNRSIIAEVVNAHKEKAKANIASARDIADVKAEICSVWSKIRQYVIWAENIPVAGKFITILADLLDSICGAG
ncbi:MAG: hypothetical protein ACXVJN_01315, partial [Mucilaginibacter sp.]